MGNLRYHAIFGLILFGLFILHHILNINWYKTLFKGKYNFKRILLLMINIVLCISMIGMIISGFMLSSSALDFSILPIGPEARKLHLLSTSWGFVSMTIHLGFHLDFLITKLENKIKKTNFEYTYYFFNLI